ncbi:MAG: DUF4388 domain-containing protein [Nannocystaceae bacterium]|nr:DUF4388 domain-containing protein [Nannocystaceae bacterium]
MAESAVPVLNFLHGTYSGREFPLEGGGAIAGRSSEADLVLADDAVSRKHVRFFSKRGRTWLRDLGSRNGTHVNGNPVELHCLREGDRLLVGSNLIAVEFKALADVSEARAGEAPRRRGGAEAGPGHSMAGSIEEIPLMDVLQWLSTSRKTGSLKVRDVDTGRTGAMHLKEGLVIYAAIEGNLRLHPEKALLRMLLWQKGSFELENIDELDAPDEPKTRLNMSLEHVLMEAARQQDEMAALDKKYTLPKARDRVALVRKSPVKWHTLTDDQLDLVQDIIELGGWKNVLDTRETDDLTLHKQLAALKKVGAVEW